MVPRLNTKMFYWLQEESKKCKKNILMYNYSIIRPLQLNIPGNGQNGVFTVRTLSDSSAISEESANAPNKKVVVIGASFIGMEVFSISYFYLLFLLCVQVAASLRKNKQMDVTVVALEQVPFERVLGCVRQRRKRKITVIYYLLLGRR